MFGRFIDWLIGSKRKEQPYRYHRHRAWEPRDLVAVDYIPAPEARAMPYPDIIRSMLRNYRPIVWYQFGKTASEQVAEWAQTRQRLNELRARAARRAQLRQNWGWTKMSTKEFLDLWPGRLASV